MFVGRVPDYFLGRPTVKGAEEYDALSAITLADLPPGPRALFVVHEFDRDPAAFADPHLYAWTDGVWSDVPAPRPLSAAARRAPRIGAVADRGRDRGGPGVALARSERGGRRGRSVIRVAAAAAAPAFGVATLTIVALALERIGVPLTGSWGPTIACALAGLGGYGLRFLQGKARVDPSSQIDQ